MRATRPDAGKCRLTLVSHRRTPVFGDPFAIDCYIRAVERVKAERPFTCEAQVILPDHIHTLWTLPEGDADYPTRIRLIKSVVTRSMTGRRTAGERSRSRAGKGEQAVWQQRYWEHTIRDERDFQAHLDYIHINPVKHGLVTRARDWPYSTFGDWVARGVYETWWGPDEMSPLPAWVGRE